MNKGKLLIKDNITSLHRAIIEPYKNFIVSHINESCLRLAVFSGEYPWHSHPDSDELFFVLEGELIIEFQQQDTIILLPYDILTIPAGMIHRTRSHCRTVNLCFEHTNSNTIFHGELDI